jgi:hypothetical protein
MGQTLARRQRDHASALEEARAALAARALVTDELVRKIASAHRADASWRGADPLGLRLDERHVPAAPPRPATLIAADGSQIYPDRHGIAPYYLINTGSIVLRQGSGQAPAVDSRPEIFYEDADLYDDAGRPRDPEYVNSQRDRREIEALASLAEAERAALGGDLSRPIVALVDGPLLLWTPQRITEREVVREVHHFTRQLDRLRRARAVPLGYVDRPNSANVLRTLELTEVPPDEITREKVRSGPYRQLADRLLFENLAPNERTGFFASTTELNDRYAKAGHRVVFCYLNLAQQSGPEHALIARLELPAWAGQDTGLFDLAQHAVYADCKLTGFPYVLVRAHELAVVSHMERGQFEAMLGQAMLRNGLTPLTSAKAEYKRLTGGRPKS